MSFLYVCETCASSVGKEDTFCMECGEQLYPLKNFDVEPDYRITVKDNKGYNLISFKIKYGSNIACAATISKMNEANNGKGVKNIPENAYLIDYVTTKEKYRGQGLLRVLLTYIEDWLKKNKGAEYLVLFPQKDSVTSRETLIAIYAKLGYKNFEKEHMIKKL